MTRVRRLLQSFCLLLFLSFITVFYASAYPVDVSVENKINVGMSVEYYVDEDASLTLSDAVRLNSENKFSTTTRTPLNFGYSPSTYWLAFSVSGDTYSSSGWVLDIPYAPLDYITLYIPDGTGVYKEVRGGDRTSFSRKDVDYKSTVFMLGERLIPFEPYFLKVSSQGSINIPAVLWRTTAFIENVSFMEIGMGIYYGIMAALVVYNLFLFFSVRDRDFLLCNLVIIIYSLVQASYSGHALLYLWPGNSWWANNNLAIFGTLIFFSMAVFINSFLRLRDNSPFLNKILKTFIYGYVVLILSIFVIGYRWVSIIAATSGILLILVIYGICMVYYVRGYKPARFVLLAWTFFLFGMVLLLLKLMGVLPVVFITEYSVQIGFTLNGMLLSFALADRVNMLRKDKEQAQKDALKHLQESERIKSRFLSETEKLVDERTRELARANEKLVELASIDILTGLSNRRVFNEEITKEFQRAKRFGKEIALIMLDIDYFKNYNDYYGHLDGDACLAELAQIFRRALHRATDAVARFGGEEFAIILCETNLDGAVRIAENIRIDVENACIPHKMSPFGYVSVSCGVAGCVPGMSDMPEDFINAADMALYKAKNAGRNCVRTSLD